MAISLNPRGILATSPLLPLSPQLPVVDLARKQVVTDVLATNVVRQSMQVWQPRLRELVGQRPTATSILALGDNLSSIFASTGQGGRGQSDVSGGGAAWEGLVCYYLNLALIGTNTIVFKKRSQVPVTLQKALTISYGTVPANTESDMVAVTLPEAEPWLDMPLAHRETPMQRLGTVAEKRFRDVSVTVVQCKTNWNDNAQIPMLWDMIYHTESFASHRRITRGVDNHTLDDLRSFAYAFVTVPTNRLELYKPNSLAVRRVQALSGGNYWGRQTQAGISKSVREIFVGAKIGPRDGAGLRRSLEAALPRLSTDYGYFQL